MTTTNTPKFRKVTYLGVPARTASTKLARGRSLSEIHWDADAVGQSVEYPAGTVVFKVVSGDFRQGTGVVHAEVVLLPSVASDAEVDVARTELPAAWS